jgi:hypothetical protein
MGNTKLHANWGRAGAYSDRVGSLGDSADQYTLGVNHNMGKRTKLYSYFTKVADSGTLYGDFQSFAVGVRHKF